MTRATARVTLLAALLIAGGAVFLAPTGSAQENDVPVDFTPTRLEKVELNFWREDRGGTDTTPCQAEPGDDGSATPFCSVRLERPPDLSGSTTDDGEREQYDVRQEDTGLPGDDQRDLARFVMDTDGPGDTTLRGAGAQFPFTIGPGANAIQYQFTYDASEPCNDDLGGTPLEFTMRLRRASEPGEPGQGVNPGDVIQRSQTSVTVCDHGGTVSSRSGSNQIADSVDLDTAVQVPADEALVVEIFAEATETSSTDLDWAIFFEDRSINAKTVFRTEQVVEKAVWAVNGTGAQTSAFDPGAPADQRRMEGRMALRSPFGAEAVPSTGFTGSIEDPDGSPVDLDPSDATKKSVAYEVRSEFTSNDGALKQYRFAPIDGERPWQYPSDVETGPYTVEAAGDLLDQFVTFDTTVAMGDFEFRLVPLGQESTSHSLKANETTTYLLRLENGGPGDDTYQLSTSFEFGDGGSWSADLFGVDHNNRVSLDAGESALVRVKVTPPSGVSVGDASRVSVTAESLASASVESVNLDSQITDTTTRDVTVFLGLEGQTGTFNVGVDRTTTLKLFAWNRGTATDAVRASFVEDSFEPDNREIFSARFPQKTFENVEPGALQSIPVEVTTTSQVEDGQSLEFGVEFASSNDPQASGTETVNAVVEAVRNLRVTTLDGDNTNTLESHRYGKFNITDEVGGDDPTVMARECEHPSTGPEPSNQYKRDCRDYTNWTYHPIAVQNTGDLTETVEVAEVGETADVEDPGTFNTKPRGSADSCTAVLPDRFEGADIVEEIDASAPGSESTIDQFELAPGNTTRVFLRVGYDGWTPLWQELDPGQECRWENYNTTLRVGLAGADERRDVVTETRVSTQHPDDGAMSDDAEAEIALEDRHVEDGTLRELPRFTTIEPGTSGVIPFTASFQSGHYDPANFTLEPENVIQDLREDGWSFELVTLTDGLSTLERDEGGILTPASRQVTDPNPGPELFHEISGASYTYGLNVTVPSEGVQEDTRETFTVAAESTQDPDERETLGLGVQLGSDFDFSVDADVTQVEAPAGGEAAFALEINNTGATRDHYTVSAVVTPGAFDSPTVRHNSLDISPGTSKTVSVGLDVPEGIDPGTTATIDVEVTAAAGTPGEEPQLTETRTFEVTVAEQSSLSLEGPEDDARIGPSGENSLSFTIVNDGQSERTVRLIEIVAPSGFETTLSDENATRTVGAQSTETFTYQFSGPADVLTGSVYPFMLRAEDTQGGEPFGTAVGHATVTGETAVELVAEEDENVVERGGNTTFPVRVENPGNQPAFYNLRTTFQTAGWSARILDENGDPFQDDQVRVPERTFERVFVDVRAPDDVEEGHTESITLTARAESDADVSAQTTLTAPIHDFAVSIAVTGAETKEAAPGRDVTYTLAVTNEGNGEDRIQLSFEGLEAESPTWPTTSQLDGDITPVLEPGETLQDVKVRVQVPGPGERPVPVPDGVPTVVRATSGGASAQESAPTATATVTTRLVKYQPVDVDGDGVLEMGVDLNRDNSDGFEVYEDPGQTLVKRGEVEAETSTNSEGLHAVDADDDGRIEHVVDTDGDGLGNVYFDPDRSQTASIQFTADATGDGQPDHPLDTDFDGRIDTLFAPGTGNTYEAVNLDFSGDGRREVITDTTGDGVYDTFVDPHESPPRVTPVEKDGDTYKLDTDGDGDVDTHYDASTQSISDARAANLGDFVSSYWWFLVVFVVVVALFGVVVYRRV